MFLRQVSYFRIHIDHLQADIGINSNRIVDIERVNDRV